MKSLILFVLTLISLPAQAYIGPGVGAGAIAAVLGVLGAIALALFGIVYYPVKRLLKKRKQAQEKAQAQATDEE